jgi:hypothetical protein
MIEVGQYKRSIRKKCTEKEYLAILNKSEDTHSL